MLIWPEKKLSGTLLVKVDGATHTAKELAKRTGLSYSTVKERIRAGWTGEQIVERGKREKRGDLALDPWSLPLAEHPDGRVAVRWAELHGGLEYEEVARLMGLTRQAVSWHEQRALRKIRRDSPEVAGLLEEAL